MTNHIEAAKLTITAIGLAGILALSAISAGRLFFDFIISALVETEETE